MPPRKAFPACMVRRPGFPDEAYTDSQWTCLACKSGWLQQKSVHDHLRSEPHMRWIRFKLPGTRPVGLTPGWAALADRPSDFRAFWDQYGNTILVVLKDGKMKLLDGGKRGFWDGQEWPCPTTLAADASGAGPSQALDQGPVMPPLRRGGGRSLHRTADHERQEAVEYIRREMDRRRDERERSPERGPRRSYPDNR